MTDRLSDLIALEKRHLWHPFTQMQDWCAPDYHPVVLVEGTGATLRDAAGQAYIDGNSSIWTNLHGHRHPKIDAAIRAQLDRVAHVSFLGSTNEAAIQLAARLVALFPPRTLERVFYSDDGSTAIEVAVKMALQYWQLIGQPQRSKFVAFEQAYHGDTAGASSLGGVSSFTGRFASLHFPVIRLVDADHLSSLDHQAGEIAALIVEPLVQGAAGLRLWPSGMLRSLRNWCDKHGVLLIFDEVLTGFGRTGKMFACEHENVLPDFLCLAKGLTGGYLPLAATLTTDRIYSAFLGEYAERKTFFYGHSYTGNALGCAAALASLDIFAEERTLETLAAKISLLSSLSADLKPLPCIREIRQCGFMAGIEICRPNGEFYPWELQMGAKICHAARHRGLLTRPILNTIVLMPPFCISEDELRRAAQILRDAIAETCL